MTATTQKANRSLFRSEEPEWLVWALVVALLAIGLIARTAVSGRTEQVTQGNASITYPADWIAMTSEDSDEVLRVSEPMETSLFPATVSVYQKPLADMTDDPAVTLGDLALKWTNLQSRDATSYKVLAIEATKVKDEDAVKVDYVFVTESEMAGPNSIPIVAKGEDVLLRHGDALTVVRFVSDGDAFAGMSNVWQRILNSLALK